MRGVRRAGLRLRAGGAVLAAVLVLSGCSAADPSIDDGTAQALDDAVVAVAEKASADDWAGALTELDALQATLDAAIAGGTVQEDRATAIRTQADIVRADLAALIAAVPAPEESTGPEPEETAPVEEEPPAEETPEEETPAPVETPEEEPSPTPEETEPTEPVEPTEPPEEESPAPAATTPATGAPAVQAPASPAPVEEPVEGPGNSGGNGGGNGNGRSPESGQNPGDGNGPGQG
ncbi:hypothetical protein HRK28_06565 [Rathayibacter sp. VKM Ac-2835]|uniref:hypothetical protein n=1 Tax=Rathayibacter sp. VKM Ac-2835 TaxID=2739043 RepID=UPI001564CF19|nr:hypothetical protein [Rathayibacter sp. VKM Ac-2835]NRG40581.1 hypothetical protein [Rathayibacter sp. VKM Ac-2835]